MRIGLIHAFVLALALGAAADAGAQAQTLQNPFPHQPRQAPATAQEIIQAVQKAGIKLEKPTLLFLYADN